MNKDKIATVTRVVDLLTSVARFCRAVVILVATVVLTLDKVLPLF